MKVEGVVPLITLQSGLSFSGLKRCGLAAHCVSVCVCVCVRVCLCMCFVSWPIQLLRNRCSVLAAVEQETCPGLDIPEATAPPHTHPLDVVGLSFH